MKFVETKYIKHLDHKVLTPFGYQKIEYVYKTVEMSCVEIIHQFGSIIVSKSHAFIIDDDEILAEDLKVGDYLDHTSGPSKILDIKECGSRELYDISLDQEEFENYWYYSSGILSHNSGKSITVACYLCWLFNFHKRLNIGIVANRGAQAREFLRNTKDIYTKLPMWLTNGVTEWNKSTIANELEMRILTDVPSGDSFRGFSVHCLDFSSEINLKEEYSDTIQNTTIGELYDRLKAEDQELYGRT